ncbi:923_t:CDS:2, partial [Paraglomus occultum]
MTEEIEQQLKDAEKMLKEAETKLEDIENILCANLAKNTENALNVLQERLSFRWGLVTTHLEKLQKLEKNSVRVRILTAEKQSNEDKTSITHMQVEESSASNESSDEESESEGKTAISKPIKTQSSESSDEESEDEEKDTSKEIHINGQNKKDNTDNDVIDTFSSPHTPTVKENGSVYTTPTKRNMDNCATPSTIGKSDYENDTWRNQKKVRLEDQISEYGQRAYRDLYTKR